jgi:hypothetical protein
MEGTDCKLAMLGKVADRSNGTLQIVNPLNLSSEFKSILENRIVATNVKAKLIVNSKYLYIRDEELEIEEVKTIESNDLQKKDKLNEMKKSTCTKDIGNANIDTEITFEYGIRKLKEIQNEKQNLGEIPFQLQITYTTAKGAKACRVYTKVQEFTTDRKKCEENLLEQNIIWSNAAQKMSNYVLSKNAGVAKFKSKQIRNLKMQNKEVFIAPRQYTIADDIMRSMSRNQDVESLNDTTAQLMYSAKKMNRKAFK